MPTQAEIEISAKVYAQARGELTDKVAELNEEIEALKRKRMPVIRRKVQVAIEAREELVALVDSGRDLFQRPRTRTFHGIKVGLAKARGKVSWDDAAAVIARIRKLLPDQAELLIKVTETPRKKALVDLPGADLKRLGVTVAEAGDEVVVKATDTEIDKMVDALLGVASDDGEEVAA